MNEDRQRDGYIYQGMPSRTFEGRRAANAASFFTPYLAPGMSVLDCGCGPGTITLDFAELVAPGEVWGIDLDASYVRRAEELAAERSLTNSHFRQGNVYALPFLDQSMDAVFASTVLEHVSQPLAPLAEMKRVLKPGGVIGLRNADVIGTLIAPAFLAVEQSMALLAQLMQAYGGSPTMGRKLRPALHQAGFVKGKASAAYATHSDPESIGAWAELMRSVYAPAGQLGSQLLQLQLANRDQLETIVAAWDQWSQHPGAFLARTFCEAIAWKE
jgi:ubiquinone/menaquinone biosynthesis C-methylase UbiE